MAPAFRSALLLVAAAFVVTATVCSVDPVGIAEAACPTCRYAPRMRVLPSRATMPQTRVVAAPQAAAPAVRVPTPVAASVVAATAIAQAPKGNVDSAAVIRRGPAVERVDGGVQQSREQSIEAIIRQTIEEVPPDDRDKCHVSVFTKPGCQPCKDLLAAWPASKLHHIAESDPAKQSESWAHFHVYNVGDASQMERFQALRLDELPAIVVQAPNSGKLGPPSHVIYQECGFANDADEKADEILAALRMRIAVYAPQMHEAREAARYAAKALNPAASISQGNPFDPVPFDYAGSESLLPLVPRDQAPEVPPRERIVDRQSGGILSKLASLFGECNGACGGWLPIILAAVAAAQQFLVRKYPNGPDDPATPPFMAFLLRILGPITAIAHPTIGPKKAATAATPASIQDASRTS